MDTLLHVGLSNALAATLLAVPVALIARVCRRPALTHALWVLVLLKLVTPPLFAVPLPWPDPLARMPPGMAAVPAPDLLGLPVPAGKPLDENAGGDEAVVLAPPAERPARRVAEPTAAPLAPTCLDTTSALLLVWLTGSGLWWAVAGVRMARFCRLLRHTTPAEADVQAQARRLAERLGLPHCPGVWLVPARVSPLLWALGRVPRLLLPADLWQALSPEQRDTLLAHELAHLRRRDHWVRRLELLVLGLFWWHPVAWWARHELAEAEEACCDAWVVWALPEAGPAYAAALVETVAFLSAARRPVPVAASGIGHFKTLKRRLTMILQRPSPRALSGAGLFSVLGLGLLLPILPTWAEQQTAEGRGAAPVPVAGEEKATPPARGAAITLPAGKARPGGASPAVTAPLLPPLRARTATSLDLGEEIQKAQDEVELLEAQLAVKHAQLKAAKAALEYADRNAAQLSGSYQKGAVGVDVLTKAQADAATKKAQVAINEAEVREPEVRLAQALRRLAALRRRAGGADSAPKPNTAPMIIFDRQKMQILLPEGGLGRCQFQMTNWTKEVVHISALRTSSAAVTATASAKALLPGQLALITVNVDARRFRGVKTFTIRVAFDEPRHAEATLVLLVNATGAKSAGPVLPAAPEGGQPGAERDRLQELEKKLDRLLKEMEELRKKLPARGATGGPNKSGAVLQIDPLWHHTLASGGSPSSEPGGSGSGSAADPARKASAKVSGRSHFSQRASPMPSADR